MDLSALLSALRRKSEIFVALLRDGLLVPPQLPADSYEWRFFPMGTVSASNPGLANLLQTLTNIDSPLLSSPSAVSAIEDSSPADIVNLSAQATQFQKVQAIFGDPQTTPGDPIDGTETFTALEDALTTSAS